MGHRLRSLTGCLVLTALACAPGVRRLGDLSPAPVVPDRPDFTDGAQLVPRRVVQVESGQTWARDGATMRTQVGEVMLRTGLATHAELRVSLNSYAREDDGAHVVRGVEDPAIGVKVVAPRAASPGPLVPTIAVVAGTSLPVGARAFRATHAIPEAALVAEWTIGDAMGLATNVRWTRNEAASGLVDALAASASFGASLSDRVGAYAELYAERERRGGAPRRDVVNAGLSVLLSDDLQLDARAGTRLGSGLRDRFLGLGLSRRF